MGDDEAPRSTTTGSAERSAFSVRVRQIRVVHAPAMPRRPVAVLESRPLVIGREPGEDVLLLGDREVSRRHAVLEREQDTFFVRDLDSHNGLLVDGVAETRAQLRDGSVVRIGKSMLLYQEFDLSPSEHLLGETTALLGPSLAMQRLRAEIAVVAANVIPVLILGATGVGKELVAAEIHRQSGRSGPLVPVNCASIPEALAESVFFGHVAGAFTGAAKRSTGLFGAAHGGTLFLDEIGEMPPAVQATVLRALESGEVRAVGAEEITRLDVRIVAATHRDLPTRAAEGAGFRGDLLARLRGWTLRVPVLRERRDDILPLARAFLADANVELTADAAEALLLHGFPYNVRELRQALRTAAIRADATGGELRVDHLPPEIGEMVRARVRAAAEKAPAHRPRLEAAVPRDVAPTKRDLLKVLDAFEGNVARVSQFFGKDRHQIYRWAKRFGVDLDAYRRPGPGDPA